MEGLVKTISESMLPIDPKILSTILMGPLNQYEKLLAFSVIQMNRLFNSYRSLVSSGYMLVNSGYMLVKTLVNMLIKTLVNTLINITLWIQLPKGKQQVPLCPWYLD